MSTLEDLKTYIKLTLLENGEISVDYSADNMDGFVDMLSMITSGKIGQQILDGLSDSIDNDASRENFINMFSKDVDGPVVKPSEFKV